jgi:hypothetical protein
MKNMPRGKWNPRLYWFTQRYAQAPHGSHVWQSTGTAWKQMSQELQIRPPELFEEWLAANFWLDNGVQVIGPTFSRGRAASLYNAGLCHISDKWIPIEDKFLSFDQAAKKFGIRKGEFTAWTSVCQ